jgi:uncharacterized protein (DUF2141 family)
MTRLTILILLGIVLASAAAETLTIHVTTEGPPEGVFAVLVFKDKKGFPDKDQQAFLKARFPVAEEGIISCAITNLPYGDYSLSILHDINDNYKADKMLGLGPPKEPIGLSNMNRKLHKQPRFEKTLFTFSAETKEISVPLFYVF